MREVLGSRRVRVRGYANGRLKREMFRCASLGKECEPAVPTNPLHLGDIPQSRRRCCDIGSLSGSRDYYRQIVGNADCRLTIAVLFVNTRSFSGVFLLDCLYDCDRLGVPFAHL
jgi:hypothetical protein